LNLVIPVVLLSSGVSHKPDFSSPNLTTSKLVNFASVELGSVTEAVVKTFKLDSPSVIKRLWLWTNVRVEEISIQNALQMKKLTWPHVTHLEIQI